MADDTTIVEEPIDDDDPYLAHFRREPLPKAGVRTILIGEVEEDAANALIAPATAYLNAAGRPVEVQFVRFDRRTMRLNTVIAAEVQRTMQPLVLIAMPVEPVTEQHLMPLFKAIDVCDHAVGRRPMSIGEKIVRWIGCLPRRLVFAVPILDVDSPLSLHRTEKLRAIPLQSASSLVKLEILAKGTFFGHLLCEVEIPPLRGWTVREGRLADLLTLLKKPEFRQSGGGPALVPAEDAQGQVEGPHGPSGEDQKGHENVVV